MKALTPFTVIASVLTPSRSRSAGRLRPAAGADNVLHSSTVVGAVFQFAGGAPAISVCICGLTVLGTGMVRAGTVRGSVEFVWVLASLDMNRTIIATMTKENPSTTRRSRRNEFVMAFVLDQHSGAFRDRHPRVSVFFCGSRPVLFCGPVSSHNQRLMRESWDRCIERAQQLASRDEAVQPLLTFYASLLGLQRGLAANLTASRNGPPTGSAGARSGVAAAWYRRVSPGHRRERSGVAGHSGAAPARGAAGCNRSAADDLLEPPIRSAVLRQGSAAALRPVSRRRGPDAERSRIDDGGKSLSVLRRRAAALHPAWRRRSAGGRRPLVLCATCLTVWPFRRVLCAHCGEEDERKLGYFQSPAYDHLRIDACDTCRHYLKTVDLDASWHRRAARG